MFQSSGTEFSPANSLHRRIIPSFTNNIENFPEFNVFYFSWLQAHSLVQSNAIGRQIVYRLSS